MDNNEPECAPVSVVMATYNAGPFIADAIRSVLNQTCLPCELHVVDDGSTDDTPDRVRPFLDVPIVSYHRQANAGQAVAKNVGIRLCTAPFIAFLDADDLWTPDKLETQLAAFDAHPEVGVVYSNFAYIGANGEHRGSPGRSYYSGWISGRLLVDNFVNGMASIVRRECFDTVGLFDESLPMGIDYDLWLRISAHYQFLFLDRVTYLYRQWPGQMSHNYRKRIECGIRIMNKFLAEHPAAVDERTVAEAWAHTYVSRGRWQARCEGDRRRAAGDYLTALRHRPMYAPAWRALAKLAFETRASHV